MVLTIIGWVVSPIMGCIIGVLATKLANLKKKAREREEREKDERASLKETCKYTLRQFLKEDYVYYVEQQKWCSVEDKEEVERAYLLYHERLGGNGQGTRYYEAIMRLPEHPTEE